MPGNVTEKENYNKSGWVHYNNGRYYIRYKKIDYDISAFDISLCQIIAIYKKKFTKVKTYLVNHD